jgi:hypothetical protein
VFSGRSTGKAVICQSFAYVLSPGDGLKRLIENGAVSSAGKEPRESTPDDALTYCHGSRSYLSGQRSSRMDRNNRRAREVNFA